MKQELAGKGLTLEQEINGWLGKHAWEYPSYVSCKEVARAIAAFVRQRERPELRIAKGSQ